MGTRLCTKHVRHVLEKEGYTLIGSYTNSWSLLRYRCSKGHIGEITWNNFQQGHRCGECNGNRKLSFDRVQQAFKDRGYRLLSKKYTNAHTKLRYECPQGHIGSITWGDFYHGGYGCPKCAGNQQLDIIYLKHQFAQYGYKLLSTTYINNQTPLKYQCPKGHIGRIRWSDFQQGYRCAQCKWKGQEKLGQLLEELFPGKVRPEDNLDFLYRQRVDFSIREYKLAFEYDGQQHFEPVSFWGEEIALKNFEVQKRRDKRKEELCQRNQYRLIRVSWREKLSLSNLKKKIDMQSIDTNG